MNVYMKGLIARLLSIALVVVTLKRMEVCKCEPFMDISVHTTMEHQASNLPYWVCM